MAVTVRGTDILFNDGTTQSTAAGAGVPSSFGAVGTVALLCYFGTANLAAGDSVAGSDLRYSTGRSFTPTYSGRYNTVFLEGTDSGGTPYARISYSLWSGYKVVAGNVGYAAPSNTAALSGTWRALEQMVGRQTTYAGYDNTTTTNWGLVHCVRIA